MNLDIDIIQLPIPGTENTVVIGYNRYDYLVKNLICSNKNTSTYVVVTEENVADLYLYRYTSRIKSKLSNNQILLEYIIPSDKNIDSRETKSNLEDFLLYSACDHNTHIIVLGDSLTSNIVGFVASTFQKGVLYSHIPTTLLSMVTPNITGEIVINNLYGKGVIGTFWPPKDIYIDFSMLENLSKNDFLDGMAEIIKVTAISSEDRFAKLENCVQELESLVHRFDESKIECFMDIASACIKSKIETLPKKKLGSNRHGSLCFGEIFGPVYESTLFPHILPAEYTSIGLIQEAELSCKLGYCETKTIERLKRCLKSYKLPIEFSDFLKTKLPLIDIVKAINSRKNSFSGHWLTLFKDFGLSVQVNLDLLMETLIEKILSEYIPNSGDLGELDIIKMPALPEKVILKASFNCGLDSLLDIANGIHQTYSLVEVRSKGDLIECCPETCNENEEGILICFTTKAGHSRAFEENNLSFEYLIINQNKEQLVKRVLSFIDSIFNREFRHISPDPLSPSTCITTGIDDYQHISSTAFKNWTIKADAIEFRVDLLKVRSDKLMDWITTSGKQLFHLRNLTNLPIVFTVRTIPQGGNFDPSLSKVYYKLLKWAHKWGCEYVDIEIRSLPPHRLKKLMSIYRLQKSLTKWIISYHDQDHLMEWSDMSMRQMYREACLMLKCLNNEGVIKLVGYANSFNDNLELEKFRLQVNPEKTKEIILINMGPLGAFSSIANYHLTPVTHPNILSPSMFGHLRAKKLIQTRKELNM